MDTNNKNKLIIIILSTALVVSVIIILTLLNKNNSSTKETIPLSPELTKNVKIFKISHIGPIDEDPAKQNIRDFRLKKYCQDSGLCYKIDDIKHYVFDVWPKIDSAERAYVKAANLDVSGYDLQVGCYFMLNTDDQNNTLIDFCFAPLWVNGKKVLDYFGDTSLKYYDHKPQLPIPNENKPVTTSGIYNTGTMFP